MLKSWWYEAKGAELSLESRLRANLVEHGKTPENAQTGDWARAVAAVLRDELAGPWHETQKRQAASTGKQTNYLSIEYLLGPHTETALHATGLDKAMRAALANLGQDAEAVIRHEPDPGLGNGGLGRLAACFLDSGANLNLPMTGYGLFYKNGFFQQQINQHGYQSEREDKWVDEGGHWGTERADTGYTVKFFGCEDGSGDGRRHWKDALSVQGKAVDFMIPGYEGRAVNTLRLWKCETGDLNTGNPEMNALVSRINDRLYPDDSSEFGKKLRLMQEYFFTSLSLQDIVARHLAKHGRIDNLADSMAVQLNDTHPAIAVPELIRILVDEHGVSWTRAKAITRQTCFYTNHTLMPEALEQWNEGLMGYLLPRLKGIIQGLDWDLKKEVEATLPWSEHEACKNRVAIIKDGQIRMGHLAAFYTARTNGVSAMHSELVKETLFPDLVKLRGPQAATNHTNGISPRRWLLQANPGLASLITEKLGHTCWVTDLRTLDKALAPLQDDADFRDRFAAVKLENKERLAAKVKAEGGPKIKADALYDVQIKRFHEYKRQFMNILHTIALYQDILENPDKARPNTVKLFAGKAAPAYHKAKEHIALVNFLAETINHDSRVGDKLKVVFMSDYNVSRAQVIIPAADISEQISTAGTEASGTSNMKFALSGARTVGTRDGANVEIGERTGEEHISFFGRTKEELDELAARGYNPQDFIAADERLKKALDFLRFRTPFGHLANYFAQGDHWKIAADFADYWAKQEAAREFYMNDPQGWLTQSIVNVRAGAHFSSDDTIRGYAAMWKVKPVAGKDADATPAIRQQPAAAL